MIELVFATNNKHKLWEAEAILPDSILLLNLDDAGCAAEIEETADTLAGNALIKARYVRENSEFDCFADDTGLEVKALNGKPGVLSARYAGARCNSEKNIDKLLKALEGKKDRSARFVTVIALILNGEEHLFEGVIEGHISDKRNGDGGFGYDPVFIPEGYNVSFAELTTKEKNAISHRGRALQKMNAFLKDQRIA